MTTAISPKGRNVMAIVWLIVFSLAFWLTSCSASYHLQRAKAKGAEVRSDTVTKPITVFIPQVVKDTVFESRPGDTVRIEKERLRIKYVELPGDSVYIFGESRADTVVKEVQTTVTQIIAAPKDNKCKWIAIALGAVFILAIVLRR